MKEKLILVAACVAGVSAVAYGMFAENDFVFVVGIATVIGSYLIIRRRLKASVREKSSN